jgi:hypothetical protein
MEGADGRLALAGRVRPTAVWTVALLAAMTAALASAPLTYASVAHGARPRARAAVVGGVQQQAGALPWQAAVYEKSETPGTAPTFLCGAAIVDAAGTQAVVTAAHCLHAPASEGMASTPIPPEKLEVLAGVSAITSEEIESAGQRGDKRQVTGVREHPYYEPEAGAGSPDDVAVLELEAPLETPEGSSVPAALELPGATSPPQEGSTVALSGFGEVAPGTGASEDQLYSLSLTLGFSRACGGEASALFLCATSGAGTSCQGDSGGAVTGAALPGTLLGVVETAGLVEGKQCQPGALDSFANVTAPEIMDFIEGTPNPPPHAPRGGGVTVHGQLNPGHSLTCEPGGWSYEPKFTYSFIDSASKAILQQGSSPTYSLSAADLGRKILCEVQAENEGGTAIVRTVALPAVVEPSASSSPASSTPAPAAVVLATATEARVSRARIAAQLSRDLTPSAGVAKIASLLRAGRFTIRFQALEAGTAAVLWYETPVAKRAHGASKPILVADGHRRFAAPGTAPLELALTLAGKRLLRRAMGEKPAKRLRLTAKGTFTPKGKRPVRATKNFALVPPPAPHA